MEQKTKRVTTTVLHFRQKLLEEIIIDVLKKKDIPNLKEQINIDFQKKSFADDGINGYDEMVATIVITKHEKW